MEEVKAIIEALIEENWPTGPAPVKEERLSAVLHAEVVQASSLMPQALADTPFAAKRDLMKNILRMQILVGKFLMLLRWSRKYLAEIATDIPPDESH
jgi:hypothetical protein